MTTAGRDLYDRGWRQGSRIPAQVHQVAYQPLHPAAVVEKELPAGMHLVLVTQDCDLVKDEAKLPVLEAIGCVDDPSLASRTRANDARFFVLDEPSGLVADRAYGAFLTREALADLPDPGHEPCGGDRERARRFARWLGARYDRVALPDAAVETIQRPLIGAIQRLCRPGRPYERLNRDIHEIRVAGDLETGPPFRVSLVFVVREGVELGEVELAIAELIEAAGFTVEAMGPLDGEGAASVHLDTWVVAPPSRMRLDVYHGSVPIPLRYESLRGDETIGAEPLDAESA